MDDFGNILYLIFIVVSLIGGIWQNAKKKRMESAPKQDSYDEPIEYAQDQDSDFINESILKSQREQELLAVQRVKESEEKFNRIRANRRITKKAPILLEESLVDETEAEVNLANFDLRKAVIYNEILNPPYL